MNVKVLTIGGILMSTLGLISQEKSAASVGLGLAIMALAVAFHNPKDR